MKTLEISTKLGFEDAIGSLQKMISKSGGSSLILEKRTRGYVSSKKVYLYRSQTMFGNPYKPVFVGKVVKEQDNVILKGSFTTYIFGKILLTVWIVLVSAMVGFMVLDTYINNHSDFNSTLITAIGIYIVFVLAGVCSMFFGRFQAGDDIEYLSNKIREALN